MRSHQTYCLGRILGTGPLLEINIYDCFKLSYIVYDFIQKWNHGKFKSKLVSVTKLPPRNVYVYLIYLYKLSYIQLLYLYIHTRYQSKSNIEKLISCFQFLIWLFKKKLCIFSIIINGILVPIKLYPISFATTLFNFLNKRLYINCNCSSLGKVDTRIVLYNSVVVFVNKQ